MADFGGADLEGFRTQAREWLEANFPKSLAEDVEGQQAALMSPEKPVGDQALWKERMGAKGWGTPTWPAAYGGGGLSPAEEALARANGFAPVTLGPRVLRAETAPLAALGYLAAL